MSDHDQDGEEAVEQTPPTEATEQRQPAEVKPAETAKVPAAEPATPAAEKPEGTQPKQPLDSSVDARLLRVELREGLGLKSLEQADKVAQVIRENPALNHKEAFAIAQGRDPVAFGRTDPRGPQPGQGALPPGGPNPRSAQPEMTKVDRMREAASNGQYRQRAQLAREAIREAVRKTMAEQ